MEVDLFAGLVFAYEFAQRRLDREPVRPVPEGMSVAANGWPSIVPATLMARLVPSSSAEPGTVTNVVNAPSFSIGAVNVWSSACGVVSIFSFRSVQS